MSSETRTEKRLERRAGKKLVWQLLLAFVVVIGIFGVYALFTSGSLKKEPNAKGLSYVSEEEGRDAREVLDNINAAKSSEAGDETDPSDMTDPSDETDPSDATESETEPESTPEPYTEPETEPTAPTDAPSDLQAEIDSLAIHTLTDAERGALKQRFSNTVVVGDSMAQAVLENGLLDGNHVFYKRGASIKDLKETIDKAMAMLPRNVIFFTGLNDTDLIPDTDEFAAAYREKINYVLSIDPTVKVYVCTMTPPSNALAAARPDLARSPLFDAELQKLPQTTAVTYIDLNWMVRQQLYLADQIHMNAGFYSVWIRYVAEKLGL